MKSEKNKTQSAVALVADSPVSMIETINAKLDSFKHITGSSFKTSGNFENINVHTETDLQTLVKVLATVNRREADYNEAVADLAKEGAITLPVLKFYGGTPNEWRHDVKLRLQIVSQKETIDALNELKKSYEAIMEKSHVKEMLDKKAATLLGSL